MSQSRAVYAKLESNSEPERARVCQRGAVRASESQSGSKKVRVYECMFLAIKVQKQTCFETRLGRVIDKLDLFITPIAAG